MSTKIGRPKGSKGTKLNYIVIYMKDNKQYRDAFCSTHQITEKFKISNSTIWRIIKGQNSKKYNNIQIKLFKDYLKENLNF